MKKQEPPEKVDNTLLDNSPFEEWIDLLHSWFVNAITEIGLKYIMMHIISEFWMGTHDSGPLFQVDGVENGGPLATMAGSSKGKVSPTSWIARNPKVLGDKVVEEWGNYLPFVQDDSWFAFDEPRTFQEG